MCTLDSKQYSIVKLSNLPLCEYLGLRIQPSCQLNEPSPEGLRVELGLKRFAAYILRQRSCPGNVVMFQSLLDKYQGPASVSELQDAVAVTGDKYGILAKTEDLFKIESMISRAESSESIETSVPADIIYGLTESEHLITVRQHRGKTPP